MMTAQPCSTPPILPEAPKDCTRCPRLRGFVLANRRKWPDWFNGAVESFGDPDARLLVVGLAPGLNGANRTGRPFTGDGAGDLLFRTLEKFGYTTGCYQRHANDGLTLTGAMITNAVRCVPPKNKPLADEIRQCRLFLKARITALSSLKVIICLGKISHESTVRALGLRLSAYPFGHGTAYDVGRITLLSSYHCSRYNTQTRRLTVEMFESVFARARTC